MCRDTVLFWGKMSELSSVLMRMLVLQMTCLIHLAYRLSLECLVVAFNMYIFHNKNRITLYLRASGYLGAPRQGFGGVFFLDRFVLQTTADSSEAVCHKQVPVKKHSKYKRCQVIVGHLYSLSATSAPVEAALMSVTSAQRQVCEKKTSIGTRRYTRGNLSAVVCRGMQQVWCFIMDAAVNLLGVIICFWHQNKRWLCWIIR